MIRWPRSALALALALALAPAAFPQQSHQKVTGVVLATDGAAVPGATVELNPGALRTQTDSRGGFSLPAVAAGQYTLRVSYIGMQAATAAVRIGSAPLAALTVVLHPGGLSQSVTVTANVGRGLSQSVNVERSAPNEIDALSSRQIRALPNANVADALQRRPAWRWSATKAKASTWKYGARRRSSATSPWTAWIFPPPRPEFAR